MASYKSFKTARTYIYSKIKIQTKFFFIKKIKSFYVAKVYRLLNFSPPLLNYCDSSFHDTVIFNFILFFRLIICHVANKNPLQLLVYMSVAQDKWLLFKSFSPSLTNYAFGAKLELSEYFRSQIYNWFAPSFSVS